MALRWRGRNRRLAVEQFEYRHMLHGSAVLFVPDGDSARPVQVDHVSQVLYLNTRTASSESEWAGLEDRRDGSSQVGSEGFRTEGLWQSQNESEHDGQEQQGEYGEGNIGDESDRFGTDNVWQSQNESEYGWNDQPGEQGGDNAGGHSLAESDQNYENDVRFEPRRGSTDHGRDQPATNGATGDAAVEDGAKGDSPLQSEGVSSERHSDNRAPPDALFVPGLDTTQQDALAGLPDRDTRPVAEVQTVEPVSRDGLGLGSAEEGTRDLSNYREGLSHASRDPDSEPRAFAPGDAPKQPRSTTTLDRPSGNVERKPDLRASPTGRSLVTGLVGNVVPATGSLVAAGLSADFAVIDAAMAELLHDLGRFHRDATAIIEGVPLFWWALSATVGLISAEIICRRRQRALSRSTRDLFDDQLTVWLYPECSGLSGTRTK